MALPPPSESSTALVTGASSGIGEALARALAGRGYGVTLVARREDVLSDFARDLREAHGVRAEVVGCDLGREQDRDRLASVVEERGLTVEILANNAGFGTYQPLVEADRGRELEMIKVGIEAVVDLTVRYLPGMVGRGRGTVITTCSTAAFQPLPGNATYAAAKAFALSFSEALHAEVHGSGVTVTALCPGPVRTGFQDASDAHDFASKLPKPMWRTPEQVAATALKAAERGRRVVTPGVPNRVSAFFARHTPHGVLLPVLRRSA